MRRDWTVGGNCTGPVILDELRAYISMQREIERTHLVPKPVEVGGESVWLHVITGAPHRAHVGVALFARALICELHEAREFRTHRRRNLVPTDPKIFQLVRVTALAHQLFHRGQVVTGPWLRRRTIFTLAVRALHISLERILLVQKRGITGRGQGELQL